MTYEVIILPRARQEMLENTVWWKENRSGAEATEWLAGMEVALSSLAELPHRCPFARENAAFSMDVRHLLFGIGSKPTHRAIFTIDDENAAVLVHAIRHIAQATLGPDDL